MNLSFQCPGCGAKLVMDQSMAGRQVRCPKCNTAFAAPAQTAPSSTPAPPPFAAPPAQPAPPAPPRVGIPPYVPPPAAPQASVTPPGGAPVRLPESMIANRVVAGRICVTCATPIDLGQQVHNCQQCQSSYHEACWQGQCTSPQCAAPARLPETMFANKVIAGRICLGCTAPIEMGQQVHNCQQCQSPYHEACWQGKCTSAKCARAAASPAGAEAGATGPQKPCPFCGEMIDARARKCRHCNEWLDGRMRAMGGGNVAVLAAQKQARDALTASIVGIFCFGIILGPMAIIQGRKANAALEAAGAETDGRATAAQVIGIIVVLWGLLQCMGMMSGGFAHHGRY